MILDLQLEKFTVQPLSGAWAGRLKMGDMKMNDKHETMYGNWPTWKMTDKALMHEMDRHENERQRGWGMKMNDMENERQ